MRVAKLLPVLAIVVAASCSDDGRQAAIFQPSGPAGVGILVTPDGGIELYDGDPTVSTARQLPALLSGRPLVSRTFTDTFQFLLGGLWTFDQIKVEEVAFDQFVGVEETANGVVARYASSDGSPTATVSISAISSGATRIRFDVDAEANSLTVPIRCDPDGTFFGFGEQYNATEQTGESFPLFVSEQGIGREGGGGFTEGDAHTTYGPMAYYLDARGFGVVFETSRRTVVDICKTDPTTASFEVVDGSPLSMIVFHGPTPYDVIRQLGDQFGRPTAPPEWAFDLWIGAQGGRAQVETDVANLVANQIPVAAMWVQDWTGVRKNIDGGSGVEYRWEADDSHYPDLAGLIANLAEQGLRFLVYANPFVDAGLPNHFAAMDQQGLLLKKDGESYLSSAPNFPRLMAAHPDFTNPATAPFVESALENIVTTYGADGWMLDFGEWVPLDGEPFDGTNPRSYHNQFPIHWQKASRAALENARPDGDWVMFARSSWMGVQAHAQIMWVGDQEATFSPTDGLPTVIPALINLGLAGLPFVTHDIAGFSGGPSVKELYLRWTELGAFTPIMRTHEGNNKDKNWNWDADGDTIAHFRRFARVHQALKPELLALAADAAATSKPIVRHLMLEFPDDPATHRIDDQYLLGPNLLVAPVVRQGATSRELYLPTGEWFNVWTGAQLTGPQTVTVDAPIGQPPVFSRGADRTDLRAIE